jgi:predicted dehydrogenase
VGLGKMGLFHAVLLGTIPGVRLVAAADANPALARPARSMGLTVPIFRSVDELLTSRPLDAVIVCTPTVTHYPIARACLERGVAVLVEKPLAEDARRAQELAALARAAGVVHAVGYHLAASPVFERARALLAGGVLGPPRGYRAWLRHAEVLGPKTGWMFDRARSGGGLVRNTGCHLVFLLDWLFGSPARVAARTESIHSRDIEDAMVATFDYPSGLTGRIEASWSVPGKPVMEVELEVEGERGRLRVGGSELVLEATNGTARRIHASELAEEGIYDLAPEAAGAAYYRQDRDFVEACRAGRPTRAPFELAARAERAIDAIYRSAAQGRPVLVE